jgi:hypothetical protein
LELKFTRSLAGVLWDLLKLISIDAPGLRRFVVAAAPRGPWELQGTTAAVLRDGQWEARAILEQHARKDWQTLLRLWQTRPLRLPADVRTTVRAEATLPGERGEEWPFAGDRSRALRRATDRAGPRGASAAAWCAKRRVAQRSVRDPCRSTLRTCILADADLRLSIRGCVAISTAPRGLNEQTSPREPGPGEPSRR